MDCLVFLSRCGRRRTVLDSGSAVFKTVCGALLRRPGWVRFPSIPAKPGAVRMSGNANRRESQGVSECLREGHRPARQFSHPGAMSHQDDVVTTIVLNSCFGTNGGGME